MFETKEGLEKGMTEARPWRSPGAAELQRRDGLKINDYHI